MKTIAEILPQHPNSVESHKARLENAKKMHRLAVANQADRRWYDAVRANNARAKIVTSIMKSRISLGEAKAAYPEYKSDPIMVADLARVRKALRTLYGRLRPDIEFDQD